MQVDGHQLPKSSHVCMSCQVGQQQRQQLLECPRRLCGAQVQYTEAHPFDGPDDELDGAGLVRRARVDRGRASPAAGEGAAGAGRGKGVIVGGKRGRGQLQQEEQELQEDGPADDVDAATGVLNNRCRQPLKQEQKQAKQQGQKEEHLQEAAAGMHGEHQEEKEGVTGDLEQQQQEGGGGGSGRRSDRPPRNQQQSEGEKDKRKAKVQQQEQEQLQGPQEADQQGKQVESEKAPQSDEREDAVAAGREKKPRRQPRKQQQEEDLRSGEKARREEGAGQGKGVQRGKRQPQKQQQHQNAEGTGRGRKVTGPAAGAPSVHKMRAGGATTPAAAALGGGDRAGPSHAASAGNSGGGGGGGGLLRAPHQGMGTTWVNTRDKNERRVVNLKDYKKGDWVGPNSRLFQGVWMDPRVEPVSDEGGTIPVYDYENRAHANKVHYLDVNMPLHCCSTNKQCYPESLDARHLALGCLALLLGLQDHKPQSFHTLLYVVVGWFVVHLFLAWLQMNIIRIGETQALKYSLILIGRSGLLMRHPLNVCAVSRGCLLAILIRGLGNQSRV